MAVNSDYKVLMSIKLIDVEYQFGRKICERDDIAKIAFALFRFIGDRRC